MYHSSTCTTGSSVPQAARVPQVAQAVHVHVPQVAHVHVPQVAQAVHVPAQAVHVPQVSIHSVEHFSTATCTDQYFGVTSSTSIYSQLTRYFWKLFNDLAVL